MCWAHSTAPLSLGERGGSEQTQLTLAIHLLEIGGELAAAVHLEGTHRERHAFKRVSRNIVAAVAAAH